MHVFRAEELVDVLYKAVHGLGEAVELGHHPAEFHGLFGRDVLTGLHPLLGGLVHGQQKIDVPHKTDLCYGGPGTFIYWRASPEAHIDGDGLAWFRRLLYGEDPADPDAAEPHLRPGFKPRRVHDPYRVFLD